MNINRQASDYISALSSDDSRQLRESVKHFTELDGCMNTMPDCDSTVRTMASILYDEFDVSGNVNMVPYENFFGLFPVCTDALQQSNVNYKYFTRPSRDLPVTNQVDKATRELFDFSKGYLKTITQYLESWTEMAKKPSDTIIKNLDETLEQSMHLQYILDQGELERFNLNQLDDDSDTCGWGPKKLCGFALLYALRPLLLMTIDAIQTYPMDELHLFTAINVFKNGKMHKSSFALALVRACTGFLDIDSDYLL